MSGSNRRGRRRAALLAGAALGLALSVTSLAQTPAPPSPGAPVQLVPQTPAAPSEPAASSPLAPAIAVDALERVSAERIGLIDESSGGLPDDMWAKSDPAFVRAVLAQLPHAAPSPAMRALAQHLLLPAAREPRAGAAADPLFDNGAPLEPEPATAPWLLEARIAALAHLGDWDNALALIELMPAERVTPALAQLRIDALLIAGKTDAACGEAQTALSRAPEPRWQKILVYCQFARQQASAAQLGLSLLREEALEDPAFFWAADALQGARAPAPDGVKALSVLDLVMLRTAGQPLPDAILKAADATTVRIAAEAVAAPPDDAKLPAEERKKRAREQQDARLALAERALVLGMAAPETVADLYLKLDLSQEPPSGPLAEVTTDTLRARAYMYRLAKTQTVPTARAEVIARVIDLARADRGAKGLDLVATARIYAPLLAEFEPTPDLIWFAGHAVRGLLAAGMTERARAWISLTEQMARGASEAAALADAMWPLLHLAEPRNQGAAIAQPLRAWQGALPGGAAAPLREGLLNLLVAMGDRVAAAEWLPVLGSPPTAAQVATAAPAVWHGLSLAAREERTGDVTALALVALGDAGPHRVAPLTLNKVIESLRIAGRDADARMLALEAALVQGL